MVAGGARHRRIRSRMHERKAEEAPTQIFTIFQIAVRLREWRDEPSRTVRAGTLARYDDRAFEPSKEDI
jgi:hypothetical protein